MWLLFDESGNLQAYSKRDEDGPPGAVVIKKQEALVEGIFRACFEGRITRQGSQVLLDGQPFTPSADRPTLSHSQIISRIDATSYPDGIKEFLRLLADLLLEHGKVRI